LEHIKNKFNNKVYITNFHDDDEEDDDSSSKETDSLYEPNIFSHQSTDYLNTQELLNKIKCYTESNHTLSEYITIKSSNDLVNEKQSPSLNKTLILEDNENNHNGINVELEVNHSMNEPENTLETTKLENRRPSNKYLKTKKSIDKSSEFNSPPTNQYSLNGIVVPEKHNKSVTENLGYDNIEQLQNEFAEFVKSYSKNKELNEDKKAIKSFISQNLEKSETTSNNNLNNNNNNKLTRINSVDSNINYSTNLSKIICRTPSQTSNISKNDLKINILQNDSSSDNLSD